MDAKMKMDRCVTRLLRFYPFWGSLVLSMEMQETQSTPTLATDGVRMFYNPNYVAQQDEEILCTDIAHEAGHKAFRHHLRRKGRDPNIWNEAGDYAINLFLKDSGLKLGGDYLIDERFRGFDAEIIYNMLLSEPRPKPKAQGGSGCPCGGLRDHPGVGNSGAEGLPEQESLVALAQARQFAKSQGKLPGSIDEFVEGLVNPKVRWEDVLRRFMETCSMDDFSWQVPDRRFLGYDMYLPYLDGESVDTFVIGVDTSGSTASYMAQFLAEVSEIARVLKFEKLYVIYCDASVYHVDVYEKGDLPIKVLRKQRKGGTSFVPIFEWLEEHQVEPKGMAVLTDTYGSFPPAPSFPVLWTVPESETGASVEFGEMIWIS